MVGEGAVALWHGDACKGIVEAPEYEATVPTSRWRRAALAGLAVTVPLDLATWPIQLVIGITDLATYDGPWP